MRKKKESQVEKVPSVQDEVERLHAKVKTLELLVEDQRKTIDAKNEKLDWYRRGQRGFIDNPWAVSIDPLQRDVSMPETVGFIVRWRYPGLATQRLLTIAAARQFIDSERLKWELDGRSAPAYQIYRVTEVPVDTENQPTNWIPEDLTGKF